MSAPKGKRPKRIEAWAVVHSDDTLLHVVTTMWWARHWQKIWPGARIEHLIEAPKKRKRGKG
jgi:hypothetical protein